MASISKDCIKEAMDNLRNFDQDELEQYVRDVFIRAKSYDNLRGSRAMERAIKEVNDEQYKSLFESANQTAKNILAYEKNAKLINEKKSDLRGLIFNRGDKQGDNISSAQKAELEQIYDHFFGDLSSEDVDKLSSGEHDVAIARVFDGAKPRDDFEARMADKVKSFILDRNTRSITSGALSADRINDDRFFRAIHDAIKLMHGQKSLIRRALDRVKGIDDAKQMKNTWRETIKKFLDLGKTFSKTDAMDVDGNLDMARVDDMLNTIYDNITTYKSEIFTRSEVANDREAIARKSRMFFVWKGLESQLEYNKLYGQGNLFNMLMRDARSTSSKVGTARVWGDNPFSMYNDLKKVQQDVKPKWAPYYYTTDQALKFLLQGDKQSIRPALSNFIDNISSLSSMARLAMLSLDSVSDVGYQAAFAQRMGINYYKAYTNQLTHLFDTMPTEERKRIAKLMKTQVDSHLGYIGRWVNENNQTSLMQKINTGFFKRNGLEAFDRGNKVGMMHMMAEHLYNNSGKTMGELDTQLQKWVGKFLSNDEWDLLRKNNQGKLFTTDNVDSLTNAQLREHYQKTDKLTPLSELRSELYRKVHSMFVIASENSVLSPTEFERAWMTGDRGTLKGELMKVFLQFKAYPMAYIDRVLVQGFQESDGATQKLKWATSMLMGTLPLSYLSVWLHNLANGVTNPDFSEMNVPQRESYLLGMLAPSLGVFLGLLDPKNQNSSMLSSFISSPSYRLISSTMATAFALAGLDPEKAEKNAKNALGYMLPIQTFPGLTPFIRQAMGDNANLQPGQSVLYGQ